MKDPKVQVYLTPSINGKRHPSKMESLGTITIEGAHMFLNLLQYATKDDNFCAPVTAQFSDTIIPGIMRDPELHIYKTYDHPQCTLCGATTAKECANILRDGRCPCDTVSTIAELIAQAKHQR